MLVLYASKPAEHLAQHVLMRGEHRECTFLTSMVQAKQGQMARVLSTNILEHEHFPKVACADTVLPPYL